MMIRISLFVLFCSFPAYAQSVLPVQATSFRSTFVTEHAGKVRWTAGDCNRSEHAPMLPLEDARVLPGAKSGFLGVVYSFLLPGMGELYAGWFDRGRYPLITEGALWLSLVGVNMAGGWVRDDARVFAAQAAGVQSAGKDDQFFVDIGNYASLAEYNAARRVERSLDRLYPEDPAAGYGWTWRNAADREKYKDQRILSDGLYKATGFVVLGLIANRIWSGIQAAVAVKDYNNSLRASQSWLPAMQPEVMAYNGNANGIRFVFLKSF